MITRITAAFLCVLFITNCSRNPVTGKKEFVLMTESQEIAMGQQYDPEIIKAYGLYQDDALQAFLTKKGLEMAKISHRPGLDYQFRILDSPVVNAFAVPGGYVYFTRGILAHFNNEAELAGVVGHEIGHIAGRHSAKQYSRQTMMQALFVAGLIFSPDFRNFADLASQGVGLLFLRFSRGHERESDKLGVEYSTEVGYNAHEMANFFLTLQKLSGEAGSLPEFLSTHPDPGSRYETVHAYADTVQAQKNLNDNQLKVNRDAYLSLIDGILYGDDPKQGYVEGGVFYHPELLFRYEVPRDWRVNNTPSQVQMAPQNGEAVILFELEAGNNLDQAANAVIERNKINVIERNTTTVHGFPARAILGEFEQGGQNGQAATKLRVFTYLIQYNNLIYKFIGLSKSENFNTYFNDFQRTMTSFDKLTDAAKINKLPQRIKIVSAKSNGSFQSFMQSYNVPSSDYDKLTLLNGVELNTTVQAGQKLKILEFKK